MKKKKSVCFIHIEKAGGTTLNDFFLENLPGFWIMPPQKIEYGWRYDANYLLRLRKFLRFQSVAGHQLAAFENYEEVFRNPFYVSFVREPVARFLSHVNWRASDQSYDLDAYLENERTMNAQCFRICGERKFETARKLIESKPYFIGVTERYAESLYVLQRMLGMHNAPFQNSNVTRSDQKRFRVQDMDGGDLARLREANFEDVKLYEWVTTELFDHQKAKIEWSNGEFEKFLQETASFRRGPTFKLRKSMKSVFCKFATRIMKP